MDPPHFVTHTHYQRLGDIFRRAEKFIRQKGSMGSRTKLSIYDL